MLVDADRIRTLRLERGWTQEQFAELCAVSVRTVQRIEKSGVASLETTNALAAVLETERTSLLSQGGIQTARTEFSLKHILATGVGMLLLGIALGAAF